MIVLLTLFVIIISGITTIPFPIGLLAIVTILSKKPWVFFLALGLGLFLDLISIRALGYTSLALTIFVFILFLYEKKFETISKEELHTQESEPEQHYEDTEDFGDDLEE